MSLEGFRISFVAGTLARGGAETQLFYILRALVQSGARPRLFCLTRGEAWEEPIRALGVPVDWFGRSPLRPVRLAKLVGLLRNGDSPLVQSQHFYTNLYAVGAARVLRGRDLGALRNDCVSEVAASGFLGRMSLRSPRILVANSRNAIGNAVAAGARKERLFYLPNVVDQARFQSNRSSRQPGAIRVLAVGRLVPQKRFDRLLALLDVLRRRVAVSFEARIVGNGPLRDNLERETADRGLAGIVSFSGKVADVAAQYRWADVLVQTSDFEGTPNVVLEAMAAGLPVVATAVGDTAEVCPDGIAGLLCQKDQEDRMLDGLAATVTDGGLRRRLGAGGVQEVERRFSAEALPAMLEALYRSAATVGQPPVS